MTVIQLAQTQFRKMRPPANGSFNETNAQYAPYRPADNLYWCNDLRGKVTTVGINWPSGDHTDVDSTTFIGKMQINVGLVFDLPTEAMWEFACRGGTDTDLYTGQAFSAENAALIMRAKGVNGPDSNANAAADCDLTSGPNIVGSYLPNAYGL